VALEEVAGSSPVGHPLTRVATQCMSVCCKACESATSDSQGE